jgi:hypothetical protein
MNGATTLLVCLGAGFFGLFNAIYAIKFPADFLKAKWTARRGMGPETSHKDVRSLGFIFVLIAGFCFWCAYVTLRKIISEGRLS